MSKGKSWDELFEEAMDNFNFHRVVKFMEEDNWTWFLDDGVLTPTVKDAKDTVRRLYSKLKSNDSAISSGGFDVEKYQSDEDGFRFVRITFNLEEQSAESGI